MASFINKDKRQIEFDPYQLPIVALPEVVAVNFKPFTSNAIMIRIADVDKDFKPLRDKSRYIDVLPIHFNDINEGDDYWGLSDKEKADMVLFSSMHVKVIYDFVDKYADAEQIVVHCNAGVSRSSAVAMGIAKHVNDEKTYAELKQIKRYLPNPRVLALMRGETFTQW